MSPCIFSPVSSPGSKTLATPLSPGRGGRHQIQNQTLREILGPHGCGTPVELEPVGLVQNCGKCADGAEWSLGLENLGLKGDQNVLWLSNTLPAKLLQRPQKQRYARRVNICIKAAAALRLCPLCHRDPLRVWALCRPSFKRPRQERKTFGVFARTRRLYAALFARETDGKYDLIFACSQLSHCNDCSLFQ